MVNVVNGNNVQWDVVILTPSLKTNITNMKNDAKQKDEFTENFIKETLLSWDFSKM